MRKLLLGVIAAFSLSAACADPVPPRLMRSIKGQHVMKATLQKGVLKLVTTHEAVSLGIYEKVIANGTCSVLAAHPEKGWGKAWIDGIEVLSRDEQQGYIFLDARHACMELDGIKDEGKRSAYLAGKTGICQAAVCRSPEKAKNEAKQ